MKASETGSQSSRRPRLVAGEFAAAVTLFLSAYYAVRYFEPSLPALAKGITIIAIVLSVVAFVLAVRVRSPAVAGMLIAGGTLMQIPPLQAILQAGTVAYPGPILGVVFFSPILILGLVKAAGLRAKVSKERTAVGGYLVSLSLDRAAETA